MPNFKNKSGGGPFKMKGYTYPGESPLQSRGKRISSTTDENTGVTTKTKLRKSGEVKWTKEYQPGKIKPTKVTRYKKDQANIKEGKTTHKVIVRGEGQGIWGKKGGADVYTHKKGGDPNKPSYFKGGPKHHQRGNLREAVDAAGLVGATAAATFGGIYGAHKLKVLNPALKAGGIALGLGGAKMGTDWTLGTIHKGARGIKKAAKWAKKGIVNKIRTGKRKGIKDDNPLKKVTIKPKEGSGGWKAKKTRDAEKKAAKGKKKYI